MKRNIMLLSLVVVAGACSLLAKKQQISRVDVATIERRTLQVFAEATGSVEAVNVVEVKSKASGQVIRMDVETGDFVSTGDTLVQLDTKDVDQAVKQAEADFYIAQNRYRLDSTNRVRDDSMYAARAMTKKEYDQGEVTVFSSKTTMESRAAALELARQRARDATVLAPINGTVIDKMVAVGSIITSSTSSLGAGTTLLRMADLSSVQVRTYFNELDIGKIAVGLPTTITVDAYPDSPFPGTVAKIEPVAVVQSGVTVFPVLIALDNSGNRLKPGMNGEVQVFVDSRINVISIPNDAIRNVNEAEFLAEVLGQSPDSFRADVEAQRTALGSLRNGRGGGGGAGQVSGDSTGRGGTGAAPADSGRRGQPGDSGRTGGGAGDVDASVPGFVVAQRGGGGGGGGGQRGGGGGGRGGGRGGRGGGFNGQGGPSNRIQVIRENLVIMITGQGEDGTFTYAPRVVRLGLSSFDYSEVIAGLQEGEQVALLNRVILEYSRQQQQDQMRARMGSPLGGGGGGPPRGGGFPGGGGGGGGGGRGNRGG